MERPHLLLDESANNSHADIWFAMPSGFTDIPVGALLSSPDSEAGHGVRESWQSLMASMPDERLRQQLTIELGRVQQILLALTEAGAVHCSLGLHMDDSADGTHPGRKPVPLLSLFTITWHNTAWSPPAVKAALAITSDEDASHLDAVELPCGPATFSEKERQVPPESGLPTAPLLQLLAHLPHPDGKNLAVLMLSTTAVHRREDYRAILRQIAEMVSFENPLATTS